MKKVLGGIRKACDTFGLIEANDVIAVGVSGGKDSVALFYALSAYQHYSRVPFTYFGVCVDLGNPGFDIAPIVKMAEAQGVPLYVVKTDIAEIVFDVRKEKSPCSLCAKMRKGALMEEAKNRGATKVALGHHRDDLLETFLMSFVYEGRLFALKPKTYMSRIDLTQIRPMIYLDEKEIKSAVKKYNLPVVPSCCRMDGETKRQEAGDLVKTILKNNSKAKEAMITAITKKEKYDLW